MPWVLHFGRRVSDVTVVLVSLFFFADNNYQVVM